MAAGLSPGGIRKRVEAETLFRVYRAFALSPVITADGWRAAAVLSVSRRSMLTGWSGAELYTMGSRPNGEHHVVTIGRARSIDGLRVSRTRTVLPYRRVRQIPVAEPARVLLDIAPDLRGRPLERLVGEALYLHLVTDAELHTISGRYPGHPGLANLTAVAPQEARNRRTVGPLAEDMLMAIDALPVPPPICEYRLRGLSGKGYRADFAWPELRVVLEADGRNAHARRLAMEDDRLRDADLAAVGWITLRFTGRQLRVERARFDQILVATLGGVPRSVPVAPVSATTPGADG
ncbi:MAG: DUF559 domain-containing protein [Solirubrobacteraceae bacterium]|nr:DUF559 domain-containing protein [Solirubrobacteraceae bacterium]